MNSWGEVNPTFNSVWVSYQLRIRVLWSLIWAKKKYVKYTKMSHIARAGWEWPPKYKGVGQSDVLVHNMKQCQIIIHCSWGPSSHSKVCKCFLQNWTVSHRHCGTYPNGLCKGRDQSPDCLGSLNILNSQGKVFHRLNKTL